MSFFENDMRVGAAIFDTHSHCYFPELASREDEIVARMTELGVTHSVQIGCDPESSLAAISLARRHEHWYATVGFHPVDAQEPQYKKIRTQDGTLQDTLRNMNNSEIESTLRNIIETNRDIVVAVGETGLDQHYLDPVKKDAELESQYSWLSRCAEMGRDYDLPLVIHSRDARVETIEAIKKYDIKKCIIHCFSEDIGFARELMAYSDEIYFSFSGILTYKSAREIQDAAREIPLDRILVETDAPFLSPTPRRGEVNEPGYTRYVMDYLKTLRKESPEEVERVVFENSLRVYGIDF